MILKRGTEPPQPDFLLVSPLDYCGLSLHIFVMDEEVRGLLELAYCAGENGLAFGWPFGEEPHEAESGEDCHHEKCYFYFGSFEGECRVDRWFGCVGIVEHFDLEGRFIKPKTIHAFSNIITWNDAYHISTLSLSSSLRGMISWLNKSSCYLSRSRLERELLGRWGLEEGSQFEKEGRAWFCLWEFVF